VLITPLVALAADEDAALAPEVDGVGMFGIVIAGVDVLPLEIFGAVGVGTLGVEMVGMLGRSGILLYA
jgi:hypothetical protein